MCKSGRIPGSNTCLRCLGCFCCAHGSAGEGSEAWEDAASRTALCLTLCSHCLITTRPLWLPHLCCQPLAPLGTVPGLLAINHNNFTRIALPSLAKLVPGDTVTWVPCQVINLPKPRDLLLYRNAVDHLLLQERHRKA